MTHVHVYKVDERMAELDLATNDPKMAKAEALHLAQSCKLELTKADCHYIAVIPAKPKVGMVCKHCGRGPNVLTGFKMYTVPVLIIGVIFGVFNG